MTAGRDLLLLPTSATPPYVRAAHDYFPTPAWVTRAILPHLPAASVVLDPCCGEGAILDEVHGADTLGIELDPKRAARASERHAVSCGDALIMPWPDAQLVIQNPPFTHAEAFVRRALALGPKVTVAAFLRLAFLETQGRAALHREHPSDVYVLSKRPSFTGNGKTDSAAYAWFLYGPGRGNRWFILETDT